MACGGCSGKPSKESASVSLASMCHLCPKAIKASGEAVGCSVLNKPLYPLLIEGKSYCPKGRHPDASGVVRWAWLSWYGVPYPLRLYLWASTALAHYRGKRLAPARKPSEYQGCGCIKALKDFAQRFRSS